MNPVRALALRPRLRLLALTLWALLVALSLVQGLSDIHRQNLEVAIEGARNMFDMVLLTRAWNAEHGGVYVPVTGNTRPNPYLKHPKRDVQTLDGQRLTLINPAFMTRQIAEMAEQRGEVVFHITSLKPIRPANAADPWEREALRAFESGADERQGFEDRDGERYLRYMAPLPVTRACLKCHAEQGYRLGDVRGGISVTQSYSPFQEAARPREWLMIALHFVVFVLFAGVSWWFLAQLGRGWLQLEGKLAELRDTRDQLLQSEKMASLGRMVAGFAHEINTPVGVAVGAVSDNADTLDRIDRMLAAEEVSERELVARLADLRQGSGLALANLQRAADLVARFKRASVDQASEQARRFEMAELIADVRVSLTSLLKRLPIRFEVDCPEGLKIYGHPGQLGQILTNLIQNSVTHGFDGGKRAGTIRILVSTPAPGRLHLVYADDGAGAAPGVVERIFEPFFTTRREEGGSGLGMYLCYNLVTAKLGGTISCEGREGEGLRFLIDIPYVRRLDNESGSKQ